MALWIALAHPVRLSSHFLTAVIERPRQREKGSACVGLGCRDSQHGRRHAGCSLQQSDTVSAVRKQKTLLSFSGNFLSDTPRSMSPK